MPLLTIRAASPTRQPIATQLNGASTPEAAGCPGRARTSQSAATQFLRSDCHASAKPCILVVNSVRSLSTICVLTPESRTSVVMSTSSIREAASVDHRRLGGRSSDASGCSDQWPAPTCRARLGLAVEDDGSGWHQQPVRGAPGAGGTCSGDRVGRPILGGGEQSARSTGFPLAPACFANCAWRVDYLRRLTGVESAAFPSQTSGLCVSAETITPAAAGFGYPKTIPKCSCPLIGRSDRNVTRYDQAERGRRKASRFSDAAPLDMDAKCAPKPLSIAQLCGSKWKLPVRSTRTAGTV